MCPRSFLRIRAGLKNHAKLPPNEDTIYGMASPTKSMTANAIRILVSSAILAWDTPVKTIRILPDGPTGVAAVRSLQLSSVSRTCSSTDLVWRLRLTGVMVQMENYY